IRARIASAEDDDALAGCEDLFSMREALARAALVLLAEIIHREVDAVEVAPRNGHIAMRFSPDREQHGVVLRDKFLRIDALANMYIGPELDAFGLQLFQPAVDHPFFQLEIRNAVTQQAPYA